jgi:hypothetical protein
MIPEVCAYSTIWPLPHDGHSRENARALIERTPHFVYLNPVTARRSATGTINSKGPHTAFEADRWGLQSTAKVEIT